MIFSSKCFWTRNQLIRTHHESLSFPAWSLFHLPYNSCRRRNGCRLVMMRRLHHFPGLFFIFCKLGRHCCLQVLPIFRTVIELAEAIKPIALIRRSEATGPFTDEQADVDYFFWLHVSSPLNERAMSSPKMAFWWCTAPASLRLSIILRLRMESCFPFPQEVCFKDILPTPPLNIYCPAQNHILAGKMDSLIPVTALNAQTYRVQTVRIYFLQIMLASLFHLYQVVVLVPL
jgi:hypothetical protein